MRVSADWYYRPRIERPVLGRDEVAIECRPARSRRSAASPSRTNRMSYTIGLGIRSAPHDKLRKETGASLPLYEFSEISDARGLTELLGSVLVTEITSVRQRAPSLGVFIAITTRAGALAPAY